MENSMGVSQKLNSELRYDPAVPILGFIWRKQKLNLKSYVHPSVHSSTIHSDLDAEAA